MVIWRSGSEKYTGDGYLELQNDGNLVLFHDEILYWSSKKENYNTKKPDEIFIGLRSEFRFLSRNILCCS